MPRKRRRESRRLRPLIRKRTISSGVNLIFKLLPFVLAVALVGIGFKAGLSLFLDSEYFKVKTIRIKAEKSDSRLGPIAIELNSKKGLNIFKVDLKRCKSDIRYKHPELKEIRVKRILPDIMEVSYKVRRPFCQVDSGYFYLVSDDGGVLPHPQVAAKPGLPIITGIDISERSLLPDRRSYSKALKKAILLLKEIEESNFSKRHKVIKINMYSPQNPSIFIEGETRIEIGEHSFKERQKLLEEVLDDLESKNRKAKIIDLRFEDVVVIPR